MNEDSEEERDMIRNVLEEDQHGSNGQDGLNRGRN